MRRAVAVAVGVAVALLSALLFCELLAQNKTESSNKFWAFGFRVSMTSKSFLGFFSDFCCILRIPRRLPSWRSPKRKELTAIRCPYFIVLLLQSFPFEVCVDKREAPSKTLCMLKTLTTKLALYVFPCGPSMTKFSSIFSSPLKGKGKRGTNNNILCNHCAILQLLIGSVRCDTKSDPSRVKQKEGQTGPGDSQRATPQTGSCNSVSMFAHV